MISLYPLGINDTGFVTLGTKLGFIALVVFGVHVAMSGLFGLDEAKPVFRRLQKIVFRPVRIE
jgi:hypothetical protein